MNIKDFVITSRVRLARNFADIPFPHKMTDESDYANILKSVYNAIKTKDAFKILTIEGLDKTTAQVFKEEHLISQDLMNNKDYGAVILNADHTISIALNEEDHIRMQVILPGLCLREAYGQIQKIDDAVLQTCHIAFDEKLGFLTACPTNVGTGLRASVMLFLPALTMLNQIQELSDAVCKRGQTVRGIYGEGSTAEGFLYQVSNQTSLGKNEEEILAGVEASVQMLCSIEEKARKQLLKENEEELKDTVFRSLGILKSSYIMTASEMMNLIGKVKLGVKLGLLHIKDEDLLDHLVKIGQPYTMMQLAGKKLTQVQRDIFRSKYIKNVLEKAI